MSMRIHYIPITDIGKAGKIILNGYIRQSTEERTITLDPKVFDTYDDLEKWIEEHENNNFCPECMYDSNCKEIDCVNYPLREKIE